MMPDGNFPTTGSPRIRTRRGREFGHHLFHEASTYHSWQTDDIKSAVHSTPRPPARSCAPRGCTRSSPPTRRSRWRKADPAFMFDFHPLVGGMPIDTAWETLQL